MRPIDADAFNEKYGNYYKPNEITHSHIPLRFVKLLCTSSLYIYDCETYSFSFLFSE